MPDAVRWLVSVIVPVHNRARLLREAVASALAQTYRPIEIVIVDDGSTDDTPAAADALAREHAEVRALHTPNGGPGRAREAGRQTAAGEFVQYLDSDDLLLPIKFAIQVDALRRRPECGVAYGVTRLVDDGGGTVVEPYKWTGRAFDRLFPALLVDRWWNTHTPLFRRTVCDAVGPWSDMRLGEDWEYDARVGARSTLLVHCRECVSETRRHEGPRLTGHGLGPREIDDVSRLILALGDCACRAGVAPGCPEMRHFSRWAFLVARQAGAAGLPDRARACFRVAVESEEGRWRRRAGFFAYRAAAACIGWTGAARLCRAMSSLRTPRPSADTQPLAT